MSNLATQPAYLIFPFLLSLAVAGLDLRTRRLPNYLTLGGAMAGLGFRAGWGGLPGLWEGLVGLGLGFVLLLLPYAKGGMGAGDVKALMALGAWLGYPLIIYLFVSMGLAGGVLALAVLWWQGMLGVRIRQGCFWLLNRALLRGAPPGREAQARPGSRDFPYGVAMALGMACLGLWHLL